MTFKNTFLVSFLLVSTFAFSQLEYGVKAGIHLNASGNITDAPSDLNSVANIKENMTGYFVGSYVSLDLLFLYVRPEIQFSYLNKNFDSLSLSQSRLEAPISVGFKFLPLLSAFAGPTLRYNFEPKIENVSFTSLEQDTSVGIHFGVRAHLGPLQADVRFDRGFSANEISLIEKNGIPISGRIDTRANVWSLGLSYSF